MDELGRTEFVLVCILKSAKLIAPCVHLADGLVDVVAVEKTEKMDHFELLKASYHYYRAADKGAARSSGSAVDGQHSPCSSPSSIEKQQCFLIQKVSIYVRMYVYTCVCVYVCVYV